MLNDETRRAPISQRLREAMQLRRLRAVDLSDRAGVPKGAISYYLADKSTPKADRLHILARALDVSEAWLMGYDVPMQREDMKKKNDQLARLIVRMRGDGAFREAVSALDMLDDMQLAAVRGMMAAFGQNSEN